MHHHEWETNFIGSLNPTTIRSRPLNVYYIH